MSDNWASLIPLVLIVAVFWLLLLRPARRQREQTAKLQASLEVGREVMTTSGIYGVVVALEDAEVHLRIADGVVIRMHRQAIGQVVDDVEGSVPDDLDTDPRRDPGPDAEPGTGR